MATKICENCGKEFRSNYKRAKYCTRSCYEEAQKLVNAKRYRERTGKAIAEELASGQTNTPTTMQYSICPVCGKAVTKKGQSKYCSKSCRNKVALEKQREKRNQSPKRKRETLCWTCQNACGGCSWSRSFEPVEGWEAKPTKLNIYVKEGNEDLNSSFFVISCPQYIPDEPREVKK